jgi:hypothetical protein
VVVVVVLVVQRSGLGAQRALHHDPKRRSSGFKKKVQGGCLGDQRERYYHDTLYTCFYGTHPNHFHI